MSTSGVSDSAPTSRRELREQERGHAKRPTPEARPGRPRRPRGRQMLSIAAMAFVLLLTAGVSIPANAFGDQTGAAGQTGAAATAGAAQGTERVQSVTVPAAAASGSDTRDAFSVTAKVVAQVKVAFSSAGEPTTTGVLFIPAPGPVLWPTDVSPLIGKGVSDAHHGQDLLMAGGTPVHAIADGTVLVATTEGSLGQYVVVQSSIAGHTVTSLYAHLQIGSPPVAAGATVTQGETIGLVGSSGAATANLLYLRILQDGALCDTVTYIAGDPAGGAAPH